MPYEPIIQQTGFPQESFLVEARSIGGCSGSPVFTFIPVLSNREVEIGENIPTYLVLTSPRLDISTAMGHGCSE